MKRILYWFVAISLLAGCHLNQKKVQTWYDEDTKKIPKEEYTVTSTDPEVREGVYKAFYETGKVKEERHYVKGKLTGHSAIYDKDGKILEEADYTDGELDGKRTVYIDGEKHEESHKAGKFDGAYATYFPNGTKKEEGNYTANAMTGSWKYYFPSGKIKEEVTFSGNAENAENGPYKKYYEDGKTEATGQFKEGDKDGHWIFYYENGQIKEQGDYKNNFEEGMIAVLDETGDTLKKIVYEKGRPVSFKELKKSTDDSRQSTAK